MSLNTDYFAHETLFLVRVRPVVSEMRDMLQFCYENVSQDWNYYPRFIPMHGTYGEPSIDPAYFWFADSKDMILFRLRFDSSAASTTQDANP
jgi:hypothetical protein